MKLLKTLALVIVTVSTQLASAEPPKELKILTTLNNRDYQEVVIREVTPSGIRIAHKFGSANLPFEVLPENLRKQLGGFDKRSAADYRANQDASQRRLEEAIASLAPKPEPRPSIPAARSPKPEAPKSGDPFPIDLRDFVDAGFTFPASTASGPGTGAPVAESKEDRPSTKAAPANHGTLTARIVGYRRGIKRVEFKVTTNCQATLEVHQVVPDEHSPVPHTHTYDISPRTPFVREVWVMNDYTSELLDSAGSTLDNESRDRKTRLEGTTLR